jgi:hypothetical protein
MNKYCIIIWGLFFSACCDTHEETTYSYDGVTIERVDECGKTIFYYNNTSADASRIFVEYSGINDGFKGYLKFENGDKVVLLSGDGHFKIENPDTSKFEYKRILAHQRPEIKDNVCFVQLSTRYEREENQNSRTRVKAAYHNQK